MAKRMTAKAVLVGLGMAAATLFGAMAPALGNELSRTGTVEGYTAPVGETRTLSAGETVSDRISTVDTKTVAALTVDGGKTVRTIDAVDAETVAGLTVDAGKTVDAKTVAALTVDAGRTVDTVLIDSDTSGVATAKGL